MFESDLPTEQELATEFSREIQLLKEIQKIKPSADLSARLKMAIAKPPTPIVSPYTWSVESLVNGWGGRLIPVTLLLLVIGLGGGYYTYQNSHTVAPVSEFTVPVSTAEVSSDPAGSSVVMESDSPSTPTVQTMMMKTAEPAAQSVASANSPTDFKTEEANIFEQGLADQPESDTASSGIDDQNDFSPIF